MILFFCFRDIQVSHYANLVTDDVIGCASTVVSHNIKNISTNNEAMLLKLDRDVAPYGMYGTHFDVAMATCSVPVSCLSKIKYYHLRLNKAKCLV